MGFQREDTGCVFCLVFCFEICKVENLQERKERGRAELRNQNPESPEGRRTGGGKRETIDSAGLCFSTVSVLQDFFLVRNIFLVFTEVVTLLLLF